VLQNTENIKHSNIKTFGRQTENKVDQFVG